MSELVFRAPSPPHEGPGDFVARSLDILRAQQPDAFGRMCALLEGRVVELVIDEDLVRMVFSETDVDVAAHRAVPGPATGPRPSVFVAASRASILDLVDGRHTLMSAVLDDVLVLRASVDDVLAFHDGLHFYLHGAVRAAGFPALLAAFRAARPDTPVLRFGSPP